MTQMLDRLLEHSPHDIVIVSSYDGTITWMDKVLGTWAGRVWKETDVFGVDHRTDPVAQLLDNPELRNAVEAVDEGWMVASRLAGEDPHEIIGTLYVDGTRDEAVRDHQLTAGLVAQAMENQEARVAQRAAERNIVAAGRHLDRMAELLLAQAESAWAAAPQRPH